LQTSNGKWAPALSVLFFFNDLFVSRHEIHSTNTHTLQNAGWYKQTKHGWYRQTDKSYNYNCMLFSYSQGRAESGGIASTVLSKGRQRMWS